jgi:hypothetical protein
MPGEMVPLGGVTDVAHMEVAGQKQVSATLCELRHRHL